MSVVGRDAGSDMREADILARNRRAWERLAAKGCAWTRPVGPELVSAARRGCLDAVRLTPTRSLPAGWLPSSLAGARVLCLACGGGQQAPLMAAAGADVTVLDLTPAQLERDRLVAAREGLRLRLEQGHMGDLSRFADASFDLVFNPVSVTYIPDALPVFRECFRVLAPGGGLLFAAPHPHIYIFHGGDWDRGVLRVANRLPFSSLDERGEEGSAAERDDRPVEHSHTLEALIGGQLAAGFRITGFYEDVDGPDSDDPLCAYCPKYFATKALKHSVSAAD